MMSDIIKLTTHELQVLNNVVSSHKNWFDISRDSRITWRMANAQTCWSCFWDYEGLSYNPNIDVSHLLTASDRSWNWNTLSLSKYIPIVDIIKFPTLPWSWSLITIHRASWVVIKGNPQLPWDYAEFSCTNKMTATILLENLHLPWNYKSLSSSKIIHIKLLICPEIISLPWDWHLLTRNIRFSTTQMLWHWKLPWDWEFLVAGEYITLKNILSRPFVEWHWDWIEQNERIAKKLTCAEFYEQIESARASQSLR